MIEQLSLPPFVRTSDTSLDAALSMREPAARWRERICRLVARAGDYGVTCDEAEVITTGSHQTVSARFRELVLADRIMDSGRRRKTRSGRNANVYVLR